MRHNAILGAAPLPGVYPGGTDRAALLGQYAGALEALMLAKNRMSRVTVSVRDYSGGGERAKALLAHHECMDMLEDVACHLQRVLDALQEGEK